MFKGWLGTTQLDPAGGRTYSETVARGFYARPEGGLVGKYDNVRTYWEDQVTRSLLRPYLQELVTQRSDAQRGVRILDLGCGAGQGYELLTHIAKLGLTMEVARQYVLPPEQIESYLGVDLSDAMVEQGRENYRSVAHVAFTRADLRDGLAAAITDESAFDLYFSSYGALSHLDTDGLRKCLGAITRHSRPGSLAVLDLVGQYSPEWPGYWHFESESEKVREYSMSYLYPDAERRSGSVERFPIRFWTGEEVRNVCAEISASNGIPLEVLAMQDRSLFVGRHTVTNEYDTCLPPLRTVVNSLFELNRRTALDELLVDFRPVEGMTRISDFFSEFATCWNRLTEFTFIRLSDPRIGLVSLDGWSQFPAPLQAALMTMDRVIHSVSWMNLGDIRANIIEPQLAYLLRQLEQAMQQGLGCGHGLLAVVRVGE